MKRFLIKDTYNSLESVRCFAESTSLNGMALLMALSKLQGELLPWRRPYACLEAEPSRHEAASFVHMTLCCCARHFFTFTTLPAQFHALLQASINAARCWHYVLHHADHCHCAHL